MGKGRLIATAPVRVDIAGGTIDLWPLNLYHSRGRGAERCATTINAAISVYARAELHPLTGKKIVLHAEDLGVTRELESVDDIGLDIHHGPLDLILRLIGLIRPARGFRLTTSSGAPAGSGLGGSSAMAIAVAALLARYAGRKLAGEKLINFVRDAEAVSIGIPTGTQDYYSAVHGGMSVIRYRFGGVDVQRADRRFEEELSRRLVVCYTGRSRASGLNNWRVYRDRIDGQDKTLKKSLDGISTASAGLADYIGSIRGGRIDWRRVAGYIDSEWSWRKRLAGGITTAETETILKSGLRAGAIAGKICGAGGGGCLMMLAPPEKIERVKSALVLAGGKILDCGLAGRGVRVSAGGKK